MKPNTYRSIEDRLEQIENNVNQIKLRFIDFLSNHTNTQSKEESLLNVKDVSSYLKVDSNIIYTACSKGELPFIKIGKSYKFKKEDILKWMESYQDKKVFNVDNYVNTYLQKNTLRG
ncbi:MAG: helix-turn-helix domain-containing protein [Bacteroidota bacterium]|nr:helix-turn-helix domain-containing protein [Bacteroidota bacterium]